MSKQPKFEESMVELEKMVAQLEQGEMPLDEAMNVFERGNELVKACQKRLDEAEMKVEKILTQESE